MYQLGRLLSEQDQAERPTDRRSDFSLRDEIVGRQAACDEPEAGSVRDPHACRF